MKRAALVTVVVACGVTLAAEKQPWRFAYQPFSGSYSIYGGSLADPVAPTLKSRNVAFAVKGRVAQQMFDAMGPDLKDVCGAEDGQRIRQRSELACSYHPKDGYECTFGFDLVTGRSINGSIC